MAVEGGNQVGISTTRPRQQSRLQKIGHMDLSRRSEGDSIIPNGQETGISQQAQAVRVGPGVGDMDPA